MTVARVGERAGAGVRVLVAMSGGVDSSVAAARLCDAGYDVVGVTLHLWDYPDDGSVKSRCCAPEDQHDARRVADFVGIPHYTFDRRALFREHVIDPFVGAYLADGTQSDVLCVLKATLWDVKSGALLFEEQAEAETKSVGPAALVNDLQQIERARTMAMNVLLERLTDRFATFLGTRQ